MVDSDNTPPCHDPSRGWWLVFGLLAMATVLGQWIDPYVSLTSQAMLYVLAVVFGSHRLDRVQSAVCALGAVAALNYFFVPPRGTFAVENREHLIALGVMLAVALATSRLATGLRRKTEVALVNAQRARELQALATRLGMAHTEQAVQEVGEVFLAQALNARVKVAWANAQGQIPDDAGPWATDHLPIGEADQRLGSVGVRFQHLANPEDMAHAQALATLLGQALWRVRLNASMLAAQGEAQRQQVVNTFLAAISHDLRTPLATVLGAATSLKAQRDRLGAEQQDRLLDSIATEAKYLTTLADNTLQLARLSSPQVALKRDWESIEEIVGAALTRVRPLDTERRIRSHVAAGLPLVRVDPVLMGQLVVNLLDNALKYTAGPIDVVARQTDNVLELMVEDQGKGVLVAERDMIFQPYGRGDGSGQRGAGLGLAVCRAIAQVHGGALSVQDRAGGGSSFCLRLRTEAQESVWEGLA